MARGRKPKPKTKAKPVAKKTTGLTATENRWYGILRAQIEQTGSAGITSADESVLRLAAQQAARLELIRVASNKCELTMIDSHGNTKLNPIFAELRTLEGSFRATLATLCLTPRARKSWRQPPTVEKPKTGGAENPFLKLLG